MRILTYTTLYPNAAQPRHGMFGESRLRALLGSGRIEARVIAPVPWFPFTASRFGRYGAFARVPASETREGIRIVHPRFPVIPRIGMAVAPWLLYRATLGAAQRMITDGFDFDAIDAHYFYPDGVAAAMIGRALNKPVTILVHGTDITLIPKFDLPRRQILWAANQAAGILTVSQSLKNMVAALGVPPERISVSPNGADLERFRPLERAALRQELGLEGTVLLSVGALIPRKAHEILIEAMRMLPDATAMIAGEGAEETRLKALAQRLGVAGRVRFLGGISHDRLAGFYNAADAMVLVSNREGWPSVLLESMACGTPVVASRVDGTPEAVTSPEAGLLLPERTPEALAAAVRQLLAAPPDRTATRAYAERLSWAETTKPHLALLESLARERQPRA